MLIPIDVLENPVRVTDMLNIGELSRIRVYDISNNTILDYNRRMFDHTKPQRNYTKSRYLNADRIIKPMHPLKSINNTQEKSFDYNQEILGYMEKYYSPENQYPCKDIAIMIEYDIDRRND
jgi:hypothetical protein